MYRNTVPVRSAEAAAPRLGDLFSGFFASPFTNALGEHQPAIDVVENADGFVLKADLPGFAQDQVDVNLANNVLTLRGEAVEETRREEDRLHFTERTRGAFARSIKFPVHVDAARVKAVMKHGVLTVTVPKAETAKTQKIKITEE
jgi:HSP20 family protein